jgi:hypothetical protein
MDNDRKRNRPGTLTTAGNVLLIGVPVAYVYAGGRETPLPEPTR